MQKTGIFVNDNRQIETALLRQIGDGDQQAFKALFCHWQPRIYRFVWLRVGNAEIAEDLVQDVFFRLWQKRAQLPGITNFTAFLFRIAHNRVIDWVRHRDVQMRSNEQIRHNSATEEEASAEAEINELDRQITRAIRDLPPAMQQAFVLHRMENFKYSEIAASMGISVKTVEKHIGEALKRLRKALDNRET